MDAGGLLHAFISRPTHVRFAVSGPALGRCMLNRRPYRSHSPCVAAPRLSSLHRVCLFLTNPPAIMRSSAFACREGFEKVSLCSLPCCPSDFCYCWRAREGRLSLLVHRSMLHRAPSRNARGATIQVSSSQLEPREFTRGRHRETLSKLVGGTSCCWRCFGLWRKWTGLTCASRT